MATLKITPPKQFPPLAHIIAIDGRVLGIVKNDAVRVELPEGIHTFTVMSALRFISSSARIRVSNGACCEVRFCDREKWWNWIFNADLAFWIAKRFMHIGEPFDTICEAVSNGFFIIWLLRVWVLRRRYFKISSSYLDE